MIRKYINRMKTGKALVVDGILSEVLKEVAQEILSPLSIMFTKSWIVKCLETGDRLMSLFCLKAEEKVRRRNIVLSV